ncbi:FAD-binding protein [Tistrella bauzanensis]
MYRLADGDRHPFRQRCIRTPDPGLEAAHSRPRILHAGGDATGHAILAALLVRARATPSIQIIEHARATALYRDAAGGIAGLGVTIADRPATIAAPAVVLATGGIGGLYAATTNPPGATGSGLALAAGLGARLRDLEFVQMHPTAIDIGRDPMPLASEALRGAGAVLIDDRGHRLMAGVDGGDLAPRDVVARAVAAATAQGRRVFLDGTKAIGRDFARRFPNAHAACVAVGLDPVRQAIPVAAAAHYHMGGIAVDGRGRTSIDGLWAVGEVAATGLHGANRLASNSLLEALVCGAGQPRTLRDGCPQISHPAPWRYPPVRRWPPRPAGVG